MNAKLMPKAVADINIWPYMVINGRQFYCIGSKKIDRYLKVSGENAEIILEAIRLMDGTHSLQWIQSFLLDEKNISLDLQLLHQKLANSGLIEGAEAGEIFSEIKYMGVDILNFRFPPISPLLVKFVNAIWPFVVQGSLLVYLGSLTAIVWHWSRTTELMGQIFIFNQSYVLGFVVTFFLSILITLFHEASHWFTAIRFGLQPSEFHIAYYGGLLPMYYVKIQGIYTVPPKQRLTIMVAGIYFNALLAALVFNLALWFHLNLILGQIAAKIIFICAMQIILCLYPFNLNDGYFIFSTLYKKPNLRIEAFRSIGAFLAGKKEGVNPKLVIFLMISLLLMMIPIYNGVLWNIRMFNELSASIHIDILKRLVQIIPYMLFTVTLCFFFRRFAKLMSESKKIQR